MIELYDHQLRAANQLHSGSILCGNVGSGKTLTALYYYKQNMRGRALYVITTPKKRDSRDWEHESQLLDLDIQRDNPYDLITVDSWNRIENYLDVKDAFFIFDEHKLSSYGKWSKAFIKIARANKWILLTATPGDRWLDYMSVFLANNFYKNKTEFSNMHIVYNPFITAYPSIKNYVNIPQLEFFRDSLLVLMRAPNRNQRNYKFIHVEYNTKDYDKVMNERWNIFTDKPIENVSQLTKTLQRIPFSSDDRRDKLYELLKDQIPRAIIFYNYTYELDIIKQVCDELGRDYYEYNGKVHDPEPWPDKDFWIYIVQYNAAEGWNCVYTDTMIFYTPNYSYKIKEQAEGRIDRINTKYKDGLTYYYFRSSAPIENAIYSSVRFKTKFNERAWCRKRGIEFERKPISKETD